MWGLLSSVARVGKRRGKRFNSFRRWDRIPHPRLVFLGAMIITLLILQRSTHLPEPSWSSPSFPQSLVNCPKIIDVEDVYPPRKLYSWPINSVTNKSLYTATNRKILPPAVVLKPKGGMGNQLFQYACHYAMARNHSWPLYILPKKSIRTMFMDFRNWGPTMRDYALDKFNIPIGDWNLIDYRWTNLAKDTYIINDPIMFQGNYPHDKVIRQKFDDYCQSEMFFSAYKAELLDMFWPLEEKPPEKWISRIKCAQNRSVAVHIRRGDYIYFNSSVPLSFFRGCMKDMVRRLGNMSTTFFLFSDDMAYVNQHLFQADDPFLMENTIYSVSYPGVTTSLMELQLMSICKHQIISFSTFSWWGAYLNRNPDKIIMAAHENPKLMEYLYKNKNHAFYQFIYRHFYYPKDWITLDPDWNN